MYRPEILIVKWLATQEHIKNIDPLWKEQLNIQGWWREIGGIFVLAARQTGKTTALNSFMRHLKLLKPNDRIVAVTPYKALLNNLTGADLLLKAKKGTYWLRAINTNTDHLVVDEFMLIDRDMLNTLLSFEWQSVTMIGTFN